MKKSILTLIFSILLSGALFAQNKAEAMFKTTQYNFGTVKEDGKINCVFEFANIGTAPLVVTRVGTSCGCTTSAYTASPVLPGKSGRIDISYNTDNRPGSFTKTIRVYTNIPDTIYTLTIKGVVTPKQR
ncbi:MAG: DUF1573 domain-containing protein [Dysgonamonadaceae bacterium]|jgi:hypothetical protein|nr:DUF1573 domain-containing protein [Dysgonamonadaceae bacterium]